MSTRPPPPSGRPPMYAAAGRAFGRTNLRPVVIACCVAAIIWSLVWAAGAFEDINGDKSNNEFKKLANFDIALGSLYAGVAAIEFFGLFAAITRRTPMVRTFSSLSFVVVAIVISAELLRTIVHFAFKGTIIDECAAESQGDIVRTSFGFWGGTTRALSPEDARDFCASAYNRMSFSTIVWLIFAALLALFFASTAYSFYRQLLDPTFFRAPRAPSDQVRLDALRSQPYGGGYTPYPGFNADDAPSYGRYAPPPGPPPPGLAGYGGAVPPYESAKLPGYGSEFLAKDVGDEKDGEKGVEKGGDPFMDAQRAGLGAGPSEAELGGAGYRVG